MDIQTPQQNAAGILQSAASRPSLPSPNDNVPPPIPKIVLAEEKRKREEAAKPTDYIKSIVRQDAIIPGLIAHFQGHQFKPQEGYTTIQDEGAWKKLTEGIAPEFHNEFLNATSPAQAEYIRNRLLQKQEDIVRLGDMGWKGNTARFAFALLNPENWVPAIASGGVSLVAGGARSAVQAGRAVSAVKTIGTAAAIGAGQEKLRQSVNFEDDNVQALEAALMAGTLTAPFAIAGSRQAQRASTAAMREREVLDLLRAEREGKTLTPEEHAAVNEVAHAAEISAKVENGELPPDAMDVLWTSKATSTPPVRNVISPEEGGVFWHSPDGNGLEFGRVVFEIPSSRKIVVEHADTGEQLQIDKADLHPESAHFAETVDEPKRFLGGSAGAAQIEHIGAPETTFNGFIPGLDRLGVKIPMRWDLFAQLNKSENPIIQKWSAKMIKDPIGSKDGFTQARTATEEKRLLQRTWEGRTAAIAQAALNEVRKIRGLGPIEAHKFHREFYEMITAAKTGDTAALHANADIAAELTKAANAYHQMYKEIAAQAKAAKVKGAEHLTPDDFYVNRQWRVEKIKEAMRTHGQERVAKLVANSFTDPALYGNVAKAKAFLRVILKTEFSPHLQDLHLSSRNLETLRAELGLIDPVTNLPRLLKEDIDALVDVMVEKQSSAKADSGNAPNLKFRMPLDEAYAERMENGSSLKVSDLMERDARVLAGKYLNSMAGHIAMAKRGIRSRAEFESVVANEALSHHMQYGFLKPDNGQFLKDLQWMRDIYDHITGRPMSTQVFNTSSRIGSTLRAWSRSAYLGQLGITAAAELKQTVALSSLRALYLQGGSFADLIRTLRSGRVPDSTLARQVEELWGFGLEHSASYNRQHEITDFTHDRTLSKLENVANSAAHAIDNISGNSSITAATRQMSAMTFIQHHYDLATGRVKLTDSKIKRLAHQGIEAENVEQVLEDLKHYTIADKTNGRVDSVDWEGWHRDKPESFEQYNLAVERETRDAIQDHDLGETIPWAHTEIGKIFMELRTFMAVAHAKNFLKNASYMDRTTFNVWTYSLVGEALMYSVQTSMNFAHNKEELQKRLTIERIAKAAVQRASVFGMLPATLDTAGWMVTGGSSSPLSTGGQAHTANTDNRNLITPPSAVLLNKAYNTTKTVAGAVNPWSETVTTQKEFRDAFSLLPGSNTYGLRNLQDYLSSSFPKHELPHVTP